MQRYIFPAINQDILKKIILLSGPRQVGKTTLAQDLDPDFEYLNWDYAPDRLIIDQLSWNKKRSLLILDELHKKDSWKLWLKGLKDSKQVNSKIIVTGSARLDIVKKMGDSLAGRFFPFRLHPLDLWELKGVDTPENLYAKLCSCSGFPEPFLSGSENYYVRWAQTHTDLILRQDMLDLESVRDIQAIETLIELLRRRVGSNISYSNLAGDLQKDPKTIKSWLTMLENLFVIFRVQPYSKNIARSLLKEPKYYFYDQAKVTGDAGVKLENFIALSLKKQLDFLLDAKGIKGELYYVRTKDGVEIDFYVDFEKYQALLLEVKWSDGAPSPNFKKLGAFFPNVRQIQLVGKLNREQHFPNGLQIVSALDWLTDINLT